MKLDGCGRKVAYPQRDAQLAEWIRVKRENKQPVSRRIITNEPVNIFRGTELKVVIAFLKVYNTKLSYGFRFLWDGLISSSSVTTLSCAA